MNQIGIIGHRGAGKDTVGFVLGRTIDALMHERKSTKSETIRHLSAQSTQDTIRNAFYAAIRCVEHYPDTFLTQEETTFVNFCKFCDIIYQQLSLMLGIDIDEIVAKKDTHLVNMRTFEIIPDDKRHITFTAEKYFESRHDESAISCDDFMTLREFITYTCKYVMKRHYGANVFVKMISRNSDVVDDFYEQTMMSSNVVKLWLDVKTKCEYDFVRDHNGKIVLVERIERTKSGDVDPSFVDDDDVTHDYKVVLDENVTNAFPTIYSIASDFVLRTFDES